MLACGNGFVSQTPYLGITLGTFAPATQGAASFLDLSEGLFSISSGGVDGPGFFFSTTSSTLTRPGAEGARENH